MERTDARRLDDLVAEAQGLLTSASVIATDNDDYATAPFVAEINSKLTKLRVQFRRMHKLTED